MISFYVEEKVKGQIMWTLLGTVETDALGKASLEIPQKYVSGNPNSSRPVRAVFEEDDSFLGSAADAYSYRSR